MNSGRVNLENYLDIGVNNLTVTSRTAACGNIDISSADQHIPDSCKLVFSQHELCAIPCICKEEFDKLDLNKTQIVDLHMSNIKLRALNFADLILLTKREISQLVIGNFKAGMQYAYTISTNDRVFTFASDV